jgi:hypothetical protein
MPFSDYPREQAKEYRILAEAADDPDFGCSPLEWNEMLSRSTLGTSSRSLQAAL